MADFSQAFAEAEYSDSLVACIKHLAADGVPCLALGQTVFWDELLKAMIAAAARKHAPALKMVAGAHDTDYFSKLPADGQVNGGFSLQPRDDYRTSQMWAAVAETSAVLGCEYPVLRSVLRAAGVPLQRLAQRHPRGPRQFYHEATAAWGWRGVANHSHDRTVACDISAMAVAPTVRELMDWAAENSRQVLLDERSRETADRLIGLVEGFIDLCRSQAGERTLTDLYLCLLGGFYHVLLGDLVDQVEITASTELFLFTPETVDRPRFDVVDIFLDPATRDIACRAYNAVMGHSGIYTLDQFGEGAIPFDIVICGRGRGTVRVLGERAIFDLPEGQVEAQADREITDRATLLEAAANKFGCMLRLVGKAVVLPTMLSREFTMVLLEHGSIYLPQTHRFVRLLRRAGIELDLHPIARLHLETWDAMAAAEARLCLPHHLERFFDEREVTTRQFASEWRRAVARARVVIERLGAARAPEEILEQLLAAGDRVEELAREFQAVAAARRASGEQIQALRAQSQALWIQIKRLLRAAEAAQQPPPADKVGALRALRQEVVTRIMELANAEEHQRLQTRYHELLLDIQYRKLHVLADAHRTMSLELSNYRPPWWWFPAVDPSGAWLRRLAETATMRLEPFGMMV
ncbi:MAG: hypothetical protein AB7Y46_17200 [Armatimonadota bacterium]